MAYVSVAEAAGSLGVGVSRIHQRIADGSLRAERIGSQWVVDELSLLRIAERNKAGRPFSPRSGTVITGVVDWDEFGLGSRGLDLIALALDCERGADQVAADRLLARATRVAGQGGLRCLVTYRAIAGLAHVNRERQAYGDVLADAECAAVTSVLDRLGP